LSPDSSVDTETKLWAGW